MVTPAVSHKACLGLNSLRGAVALAVLVSDFTHWPGEEQNPKGFQFLSVVVASHFGEILQ